MNVFRMPVSAAVLGATLVIAGAGAQRRRRTRTPSR